MVDFGALVYTLEPLTKTALAARFVITHLAARIFIKEKIWINTLKNQGATKRGT